MSWIITLLVGVVVGWIAGAISVSIRSRGLLTNVIEGIAGAIIGYWLFVTALGLGPDTVAIGTFSGIVLIWEIIGAVGYLIIVNALSYGEEAAVERRYGETTAHEYDERHRRKK